MYVILFPLLSLVEPIWIVFVIVFDIHPLYTKNRGICESIYIHPIFIYILSTEPANHISLISDTTITTEL